MSDGPHTFNISIRYHQCPHCKNIFESRGKWDYASGMYIKKLTCPNCSYFFKATKPMGPIGPLFGEPSKTEFDWS